MFDYLLETATRNELDKPPSMTIGLAYFPEPGDSRFDQEKRELAALVHAQRRPGSIGEFIDPELVPRLSLPLNGVGRGDLWDIRSVIRFGSL